MKFRLSGLMACLLPALPFTATATTRYVSASGTNPVSPYATWATAATNIQDAINVAGPGSTILVTNGIYQYGAYSNSGSNRVYVYNNITVQSVNGPAVTVIVGYQVPGTTNGNNAIRCVYMNDGTTLSGFTLTNGATPTSGYAGGGIYCQTSNCVVSNCVITGNAASGGGGGAFSGTLVNCSLVGNSTTVSFTSGGAADNSILINCAIVSNRATGYGGGAYESTLVNCTLTGNSATQNGYSLGGGAYSCSLSNCVLAGNFSAYVGGAACAGTLNNCLITNNTAQYGGGVASNTASDCLFIGNGTTNVTSGGAAFSATLNNCTLVGNFSQAQGAASGSTLNNCISYYNSNNGYADCYQCTVANCCTTIGSGNPTLPAGSFTNAPGFVDLLHGNYRLQTGSPCINAGNNSFVTNSVDLDGNPRIVGGTVDLGAYENQNPNVVVHYVSLAATNPVSPFTNWNTATTNIQTAVAVAQAGEFVVADSGTYSQGSTIVYGAEANRVALTNPIVLLGVNGPQSTIITSGASQTRCVYVGSNAVLSGFTLTYGTTRNTGDTIKEQSGAGAWCETSGVVSNCVVGTYPYGANASFLEGGGVYGGTIYNSTLVGNNAQSGGGAAGAVLYNCVLTSNLTSSYGNIGSGAYQSTLYNCTLTGNQGSAGGTYNCTNYNCILAKNSGIDGGGAYGGTLYNCTVVSNTASSYGGGVYLSTAYNSIIYSNSAQSGNPNYNGGTFVYCDTTPLASGYGNITNNPDFVNFAGGSFHLQSSSPCINSGNNSYVTTNTDLDGNPRIAGGTVDIGAYEYQTPSSIISYAWLQQYGLPTDGSADFSDPDGDGMNDWQEWIAGTNPTNAASVLKMSSASNSVSGVIVTWQSVSGINYFLQRSTNLSLPPAFTTIQTNLAGQVSTTSYTDTTATNGGPFFYRVGVQSDL